MDNLKIRLFQLKKQNLIGKAKLENYRELLQTHMGLHSTDYLTPYFSLWARVDDFDPLLLLRDLNDNRTAIRLRVFRGTLFVVHVNNLADIIGSSGELFESRLVEAQQMAEKVGVDLKAIANSVINLLAENNYLSTKEIKKIITSQFNLKSEAFILVQRYLEFKQILARTGQRYFADPVIKYGLMEDWIPEFSHGKVNSEQAIQSLVLKYIKMFGPVCLDDICWWFPLKKTRAREILANLDNELVYLDFNNRQYLMEKADYFELEQFNQEKVTVPIINFLPYEDHFPKAYYIRDWFVSKEMASSIFNVGKIDYGQLRPTIWLNGEIIGRWELDWTDKSKSSRKVEILTLKEAAGTSQNIIEKIEEQRYMLERFVNEKLTYSKK